MPIGISDDHVELADAFGKWAALAGRDRGCPCGRGRPRRDVRGDHLGDRRDGAARRITADGGSLTRPRGRRRGVRRCAAARAAARFRGRLRRPPRAGRPGRRLSLDGSVVHDAPGCDPRPGRGRRRGAARAPRGRRPHARRQPRPDPSYLPRRPDRRRGHRRTRPHAGAARARSSSRWPPPRPRGSRGGAWTRRSSTPGARAVRPEDRRLPGDQAPVRARCSRPASP